jgi:regulation of enolase protein 1 (concanavalin A-like superfamily)
MMVHPAREIGRAEGDAVHWLNEPARWAEEGGLLAVTADPGTDFWRTAGYGYVRDNGHLYGDMLAGDFDLAMRLTGAYAHQYDQAGAMVRVDERLMCAAPEGPGFPAAFSDLTITPR